MTDYTVVYTMIGVLLFAFVGIVIWFILEIKPLSNFQPPNKNPIGVVITHNNLKIQQ